MPKNFVRINGRTYALTRWKYEYWRGGRVHRHWLQYIVGWCRGKLVTICLGIAKAADVVRSVGQAVVEATYRHSVFGDVRIRERLP